MNSVDHDPPRRRPRLRFSLLALFVFMTLVCLLLAWWVQPRPYVVEALFHVSRAEQVVAGELRPFDAREYEIIRQTQIAQIKSHLVLQAALRDPTIAKLSVLASEPDQVEWLAEHLEVEFLHDSELLVIRMRGTEGEAEQLRQLVDAVAEAYLNEVVYEDEQRRGLARDARWKSLLKLRDEIEAKMLRQQKDATELADDSVEARLDKMELDSLIGVWRQMSEGLEIEDANMAAPPRIRQIQPAAVRPE